MAWQPIVAGIDGSDESSRAAALAWCIAQAVGAELHIVHATKDLWSTVRALSAAAAATATGTAGFGDAGTQDAWLEAEHARVRATLSKSLSAEASRHLEIQVGRAPTVLARRAAEVKAGLVVVGGKHHGAMGRWLVGTTAHHLARRLDAPLLVAGDAPATISRILVAVDLSQAAPAVIAEAERFAGQFQASFMALHAVEPLPTGRDAPIGMSDEEVLSRTTEVLEASVWPSIRLPHAEKAIRKGPAYETILEESRRWNADLVVIGSHGSGWDDRVLLGRVTESLLDDLPSSLLIVPVS